MKLFFIILFLGCSAFAIDTTDYTPSTLKEISLFVDHDTGSDAGDYFIAARTVRSVVVDYMGEIRKIGDKRLAYIKGYANMLSKPAVISAYRHEIKVKESGAVYWIPVQETFAEDLKKELKAGQKFIAYLGVAGRMANKEQVLLMMDFSSAKADVNKFPKK